jgi:GNAT superfamily N-acetyltransferase
MEENSMFLRQARISDMPFMREMLYEAVYWRASIAKPSFEDGLAPPGVNNALAGWNDHGSDAGVIAQADAVPVGAAWYRFYTKNKCIRGHMDDQIPTLVIAVAQEHRGLGIGKQMIKWLTNYASQSGIHAMSLMVSKDNHAASLYRQCGFVEYAVCEDSWLMLRKW